MNDISRITLKGELESFLINGKPSWELVVASKNLAPADRMVRNPSKTGDFLYP